MSLVYAIQFTLQVFLISSIFSRHARLTEHEHQHVKAKIDSGQDVEGTVHDVAGLLKQFLRDLPDPLFTHALYPSFVAAQQLNDPDQRRRAVFLLCLQLPDAHFHALKFVMHLLYDVVHAPGSRMSPANLAAIFTPNVLRPNESNLGVTGERELSNHAVCVSVLELLIDQHSALGWVPQQVLQAANQYASEEKSQAEYMGMLEGHRSWWR